MNTDKLRFWLASAALATCLLVQPVSAGAQCMVTDSSMGSGTNMGMMYIYVGKSVTPATMCTLTMFMNVFGCFPGGQTPTGPIIGMTRGNNAVSANAFTTAMNVSCGWQCQPCGAVVINGAADGLPVELLDFKVTAGPQARRSKGVTIKTSLSSAPRP